jgi:hypothetical protein
MTREENRMNGRQLKLYETVVAAAGYEEAKERK